MALKRVYQDRKYYNRELETLLQLSHPNIVRLNYFSVDEKTEHGCYLNLFFELGDVSFEQLIAQKARFSEREVRGFFLQGLAALKYLESMNIVHRDIKPANILLVGGRAIKICDFGSAKRVSKNEYNSTYICSRYYRAPENILGIVDYDCRIDVWSMGLSFLELFVFSPVFSGESNKDQLSKILEVTSVSETCRIKHNLHACRSIGIENYLKPIVSDPGLVFLFEHSIVFERDRRLQASKLIEYESAFEPGAEDTQKFAGAACM
ncbi:UNVERIFIED_CONTAM: hypothetical protein PYX00_010844 [Menopon gallinae]|uniref:Protein kinase domain-containing protein n=1 Tax=Menopon gallinae TaxID=328185 RepID=A0AAW2H680_9NEOP